MRPFLALSTASVIPAAFHPFKMIFLPFSPCRNIYILIAGQTILPGTIFPSTVGRIPIELSRYIWHALQREAVIKGEVTAIKYKRSPLVQGGLEIPIAVTVKWDDKNAVEILRKKVEEVSYPLGEDDRYTDESKDILN